MALGRRSKSRHGFIKIKRAKAADDGGLNHGEVGEHIR